MQKSTECRLKYLQEPIRHYDIVIAIGNGNQDIVHSFMKQISSLKLEDG